MKISGSTKLPGKVLAFVDFMDCADLQKIVAFEIGAGPFTPELSDATAPSIAAAIIPAP